MENSPQSILRAHPVALSPNHEVEKEQITEAVYTALTGALLRFNAYQLEGITRNFVDRPLEIRMRDCYFSSNPRNVLILGHVTVSGFEPTKLVAQEDPGFCNYVTYVGDRLHNLLVKHLYVLLTRDNFVINEKLVIKRPLVTANGTDDLTIEFNLKLTSMVKPRIMLVGDDVRVAGPVSGLRSEATTLEELLKTLCQKPTEDSLCPYEVVSYLQGQPAVDVRKLMTGIAIFEQRHPDKWEDPHVCYGDVLINVSSLDSYSAMRAPRITSPSFEDTP